MKYICVFINSSEELLNMLSIGPILLENTNSVKAQSNYIQNTVFLNGLRCVKKIFNLMCGNFRC